MPEGTTEPKVMVSIRLETEDGTMLASSTIELAKLKGLYPRALGNVLRQALIDTCSLTIGEKTDEESVYLVVRDA